MQRRGNLENYRFLQEALVEDTGLPDTERVFKTTTALREQLLCDTLSRQVDYLSRLSTCARMMSEDLYMSLTSGWRPGRASQRFGPRQAEEICKQERRYVVDQLVLGLWHNNIFPLELFRDWKERGRVFDALGRVHCDQSPQPYRRTCGCGTTARQPSEANPQRKPDRGSRSSGGSTRDTRLPTAGGMPLLRFQALPQVQTDGSAQQTEAQTAGEGGASRKARLPIGTRWFGAPNRKVGPRPRPQCGHGRWWSAITTEWQELPPLPEVTTGRADEPDSVPCDDAAPRPSFVSEAEVAAVLKRKHFGMPGEPGYGFSDMKWGKLGVEKAEAQTSAACARWSSSSL